MIEMKQSKVNKETEIEEDKTATEIINEWLNGPQDNKENKVTQQDIYNEYITGNVTPKGD